MKEVNIIAAISKNYVIGLENSIPWNFKEDLLYFRNVTSECTENKKNAIIMGYNTHQYIPFILKNRINIVIDRTCAEVIEKNGYIYCCHLHNAIDYCNKNELIDKIFIIGGQKVYQDAIKLRCIQKLYLTYIDQLVLGDKYFPMDYNNYFDIISEKVSEKHSELLYQVYQRKSDEQEYLNLIRDVLQEGVLKNDRTNTGIISHFGHQMRFNIEHYFPLLTTKKMFLRGIIEELLWFLNGQTDAKILQEKRVHIWDLNSSREFLDSNGLSHYEDGDCGPIYGFNFRHYGAKYVDCHADYSFQGFDQLQNILNLIRENPNSRRILINLWNPCDLDKVVLPPCHVLYQFWVYDGKISCSMYQRSGDIGLGIPFNIASASLLTYILAKLTGLVPFEFIHTIGDAHIYTNHIEQLKEQITRKPYEFPTLTINDRGQKDISDFVCEDFILENYKSHDKIKMQMK